MVRAAVEDHLDRVLADSGRLDVSFNAVSLGDAQGAPLIEMEPEHFSLPVETAVRAQFLTTTAAARRMLPSRSGVILAITANAGRQPYPNVGGFGVACAAIEALCRQVAAEVGPYGIRVVCLRSSGAPDAPGVREAWRLAAAGAGISLEEWEARFAERTLLKRLPRLAEIANAAVLMASDRASAMTSAIANLTAGEIADC